MITPPYPLCEAHALPTSPLLHYSSRTQAAALEYISTEAATL